MPPYKPMKRRDYEKWIRQFGWSLTKSSWDWTLRNADNARLCTVKVTHPGGEIPPYDVRKTEKLLQEEGLI
jgi:hypothetical protein